MRVFLYTFSSAFTKELAIELIPLGVEPVEVEARNDLFNKIAQFPEVLSLVTEHTDLKFIEQLRDLNPNLRLTLLAHQNMKPAELIGLSRFGIRQIINYEDNPLLMAEEIQKQLIADNGHQREKRLHVRVRPKSKSEITGGVYLREKNRFVHGEILDISAGGFAIRLNQEHSDIPLTIGRTYDPVLLNIVGTTVKTLSRLTARRDSVAGFQFDNIETTQRKRISEYIYQRLSAERGGLESLMEGRQHFVMPA